LLGDRFLICDLWDGNVPGGARDCGPFATAIGTQNLKYGAAYHPFIETTMAWNWDETTITVSQVARRNDDGNPDPTEARSNGMTLAALRTDPANANPLVYANVPQRTRALQRRSTSRRRHRRKSTQR